MTREVEFIAVSIVREGLAAAADAYPEAEKALEYAWAHMNR